MRRLPVTRRHILGTAGISLTTGCIDLPLSDSGSGVRIGSIFVGNRYEETPTVHLQLYRNDEIVYDEIIEIDGDSREVIDPSWDTEPAEFTLLYATETELEKVEFTTDYSGKIDAEGCNHPALTFPPLGDSSGSEVGLWSQDDPSWGSC
ncbi:hypothetical protein [Natrinema sp. DC36]|uniref:hypothetical protein n=1 Tax=Natrinema sp. DC36 TaxID=2878680 RepID=UPI001CF03FE1|nr:hypothetical protein [Natrinema sp. DC36]